MSKISIAGLMMLIALPGGVLLAQQGADATAVASRADKGAVIGPGDTVTIVALHCEEISRAWRVGPSGRLSLPIVGNVQVAGLTVEDFEQDLAKRLRKYVIEPQVSAYISESRSRPVMVTGAVEKAGLINLEGSQTLFDILLIAAPKDPGPIVTVSRSKEAGPLGLAGSKISPDGQYWTIELPLEDVMNGRSPAAGLALAADDVIVVAERRPRLVHIIGEVARPGSVELLHQETVSITKLLASAGGLTRGAKPEKTIVRHISAAGTRTETAVINMKKIISGKSADLELSAGDVVIVPSSQWLSYLQSSSLSAISAGVFTGLQVLARF
jgi:polysaccharide export outer membrane protein